MLPQPSFPTRRLLLLVGVLVLLAGGPGVAQQPDTATGSASGPAVSPPLPAEHWAVRAAERAEAMGLVREYLPAQRSVPVVTIADALREAAARAPVEAPGVESLARGWWERFAEEFPGLVAHAEGRGSPVVLGAAATAGYRHHTGRTEAGSGLFGRRTEPVTLPDRSGGVLGASLMARPTRFLAVATAPEFGPERMESGRWDVTVGWRSVAVSVGEQPVGYGPGVGGGVVLSGTSRMPRIELETVRPVTLPGFLRYLGPTSFHTFASRFSETRHPGDPYFWGMRAAIRPHPRISAAVNRAAIFGGDSSATPATPGNLLRMFLGILSRDFENQVVSADFRYRLPTEAVIPLTAYLEWGAEDAAGAWWDVPGRVVGISVPAVPRLPGLALGAEWARFPLECCGNPPWYLHLAFPGGWVRDGRPLGHPVGGEGSEYLFRGNADLAGGRVRLDGRVFLRDRGDRGFRPPIWSGNLYAPDRAGSSTGVDLHAAWRPSRRSDLSLMVQREVGDGWTEQRVNARMAFLF
ncbi:MAG TPA: capsule assembly Wzi family protein [Longimicrobiaceae bacterium]|nr:capsule assembly Wzi family protein [Longimicrobiaceae bacterium]